MKSKREKIKVIRSWFELDSILANFGVENKLLLLYNNFSKEVSIWKIELLRAI